MKLSSVLLIAICFNKVLAGAQPKLLVTVQQEKDSVSIFNLGNNQRTAQLKIGYKPHEICYDPITKRCFITDFGLEDYDHHSGKTGNGFHVIDPFSGKIIKKVFTTTDTATGNGPHGVKVRPAKFGELFVNMEIGGDTMIVYNVKTLEVKRKFALPKGTHNFSFSAKGDTLWLMAGQNGVYQVDPENGEILRHTGFPSPIRGLSVAKKWIVASGFNELFLLSKTDLSVLKHFQNLQVGQLFYSNVSPDQKFIIAPAALNDSVLIVDAETGEVVHRLNTGKTPINVQISGNYAYVSQDKDYHIGVVNLKTFEVTSGVAVYGTNGIIVVE
jgi:DNA-binding beta-propeller fold protein YncE